ncbi:MAG TPA: helix-turn-helix transcriptional regulator [Actinomycetota bacterium]
MSRKRRSGAAVVPSSGSLNGPGRTRRRDCEGTISGYVLKLIRESVGHTQESLSRELHVDPQTVQGWESSRRPLTATRSGALVDLRRRLRALGAEPDLLESLNHAMEADFLLSYALSADPEEIQPDDHPLARWVLPRAVSEMLAWPFNGQAPERTRGRLCATHRRGPVADGPVVSPADRTAFFEHFRAVAERSLRRSDLMGTEALLLRRQAYYQLARARDPAVSGWLDSVEREEVRRLPRTFDRWAPSWVAARSLAVARCRCGDRDALREFIARGFESDECQRANLHYWAYWFGEAGPTAHADEFMTSATPPGTSERLARRLEEQLVPGNPCLDLYAHSLWALLKRHNGDLLTRDGDLRYRLAQRAPVLLDSADLSSQSRAELGEVWGYLQWLR